MTADDRPLDPRRARALADLLAGTTREDAAATAGVSPRTLRRWQTEPFFAAEYRKRAREIASTAHADLLAATGEAVQALRVAMADGSPATRVRAARSVLEVALRISEDDFEQRLTALEGREANQWPATLHGA